jgi:hypothetical protein
MAANSRSGLGVRRAAPLFHASKLTRGDYFGYPQTVTLGAIGGHALFLLFLPAVFREDVEAPDAIGRL